MIFELHRSRELGYTAGRRELRTESSSAFFARVGHIVIDARAMLAMLVRPLPALW